MKEKALLILIPAALLIFFLPASGDTGITGVWEGETYVPDYGQNKLTLEITQEDGKYAAVITDSAGYAVSTPCDDFEYQEGKITFNFPAGGGLYVYIYLSVEGDTLEGFWEVDYGSGDITMKKKK